MQCILCQREVEKIGPWDKEAVCDSCEFMIDAWEPKHEPEPVFTLHQIQPTQTK